MQPPRQGHYRPCFCGSQVCISNFEDPITCMNKYAHKQNPIWVAGPNHGQTQGDCVVRALWLGIVHGHGYLTAVKLRRQIREVDSGAVKGARNIVATIHPADGILVVSIELCRGSETQPCRREEEVLETPHVVDEKIRELGNKNCKMPTTSEFRERSELVNTASRIEGNGALIYGPQRGLPSIGTEL